jgi:hypothetical protein
MRPAYITTNEAGYEICQNRFVRVAPLFTYTRSTIQFRLQYLVRKGAIIRKGYAIHLLIFLSSLSHAKTFVAKGSRRRSGMPPLLFYG